MNKLKYAWHKKWRAYHLQSIYTTYDAVERKNESIKASYHLQRMLDLDDRN